jgi:hypothetical protein
MSSAPEATPQSGTSAAAKRPGWVWVITIFYVFSVGFTLLSFMLMLAGALPLTPAQQAYFAGLGPFDYIMSLGLGLLTLTATVLLFLLKRAAVPLFAASFVLNISFMLVHAFATNWAQALGGSGLVGAFIGWGILGAVALYSRHLRQASVLR